MTQSQFSSDGSKTSKQEITNKFKIGWGIAALGNSIISNSYAGLLGFFYVSYMGLGSEWIGLAALIYAIWNAINDPLFGFLSDNSRSKKGRRIPFMRYTAPLLALTFILVWMVPPAWNELGKFVWMLVTMLLYDTCYTIIGLVYSALLPEITEDDGERGALSTVSSLFSLIGMVLGFLLPDIFRGTIVGNNYTTFYIGLAITAVIASCFIIITTFVVKERPEFTKVDKPLKFWPSITQTFKSRSFLILAFANFMSILMQSIVLGGIFYIADYILKQSTIIVLAFLIVGLIIGVLVVNRLAKRFGVVKTQQFLLVIAGIFLMLIIVVPDVLIYVCLFIAGVGLSGPLVLTNVMFAQVSDEDEIKSGVRREAMFFGVNALITKPAQSVALWLSAWILLDLSGYITKINGITQPQPPEAIMGMKIYVGLIPGIAMILGAVILFLYPLKGNKLKEVQETVLKMHEEKHKILLEQNK